MAKLSSHQRDALAKSDFALPGSRRFPIEDSKHARLAKSGASRAEHVGNISAGERSEIDRKADAKLGKGPAHGYGR